MSADIPDSRHELEAAYGLTVLVTDETAGKLLAITKDIVAKLPYNEEYGHIPWEACTLRRWLNHEFYVGLPDALKATVVPMDDELGDRVFLLSVDEATACFEGDAERAATHNGKPAWWWLRTPGIAGHAAFVSKNGAVNAHGYNILNRYGGGARPAMWLDVRGLAPRPLR
jgi:hypothetical protein